MNFSKPFQKSSYGDDRPKKVFGFPLGRKNRNKSKAGAFMATFDDDGHGPGHQEDEEQQQREEEEEVFKAFFGGSIAEGVEEEKPSNLIPADDFDDFATGWDDFKSDPQRALRSERQERLNLRERLNLADTISVESPPPPPSRKAPKPADSWMAPANQLFVMPGSEAPGAEGDAGGTSNASVSADNKPGRRPRQASRSSFWEDFAANNKSSKSHVMTDDEQEEANQDGGGDKEEQQSDVMTKSTDSTEDVVTELATAPSRRPRQTSRSAFWAEYAANNKSRLAIMVDDDNPPPPEEQRVAPVSPVKASTAAASIAEIKEDSEAAEDDEDDDSYDPYAAGIKKGGDDSYSSDEGDDAGDNNKGGSNQPGSSNSNTKRRRDSAIQQPADLHSTAASFLESGAWWDQDPVVGGGGGGAATSGSASVAGTSVQSGGTDSSGSGPNLKHPQVPNDDDSSNNNDNPDTIKENRLGNMLAGKKQKGNDCLATKMSPERRRSVLSRSLSVASLGLSVCDKVNWESLFTAQDAIEEEEEAENEGDDGDEERRTTKKHIRSTERTKKEEEIARASIVHSYRGGVDPRNKRKSRPGYKIKGRGRIAVEVWRRKRRALKLKEKREEEKKYEGFSLEFDALQPLDFGSNMFRKNNPEVAPKVPILQEPLDLFANMGNVGEEGYGEQLEPDVEWQTEMEDLFATRPETHRKARVNRGSF